MRVLVTADLHYDIARSIAPTRALAARMVSRGGDAVMILGDVCGTELETLTRCLSLFEGFRGARMFVAGNHDLWVKEGASSVARYETEIPAACASAGFHPLDCGPLVLGDVGFVGSVGWYDYSFRDRALDVPLRFYEAKTGPGYAAATRRPLLLEQGDLTEALLRIRTRWMDGEFVRLPYGDPEFTVRLRDKLRSHVAAVEPAVRVIVAGIHHLPFHDLVVKSGSPEWDFGNAFMGSGIFGDVLVAEPRARLAFCGHSHSRGEVVRDHVRCVNVGCTYVEKRCEEIEI
jgi:predicted phosphodiesterase